MGSGNLHDDPTERAPDSFESFLRQVARVSEARGKADQARFSSGARLANGRFEILRHLGEGGMGVVYEAFDNERRGKVALKTLTRVDAAGIYRLKNEFRALADVHHPNLVRLHELFADEENWFFTMGLVEGERFDHWFDPRDPKGEPDEAWFARVIAALRQLADAVRAIHRAGKLHRDLKPSNVMVDQDGRVRVLDFGLVADPELGGVGQTLAEEVLSGTPAYMAPEQAAGRSCTEASDWYAVGVMLYEVIAGRLPFAGNIVEMLAAKQTVDPTPLLDLRPETPPDLASLCMALLERDPAARPGVEAIRRVVGSEHAVESRRSIAPEAGIDLIGREEELAALRSAYQATLDVARPVIVMVSGESGMGKSALMETFLTELQRTTAAVVLQGRCYEREAVPFKAFDALIDVLSRHLRRLPPEDAALLTPREAWALQRLFPVLGRLAAFGRVPPRAGAEPYEVRRRGFVALGEVLGGLRDRGPLVLYIDDLQWGDADSIALLVHLLRQSDAPNLLFVGTLRDGEHPVLDPLYDKLCNDIRVDFRDVKLGPLSDANAAAVVGGAASDGALREARGNPFLLRELGRYLERTEADDPRERSLSRMLAQRCEQLQDGPRRLLRIIALAAGSIPVEVAAAAAHLEPAALDALREGQFVRRGARSGEIECYHDKIREVLVAALSKDETRELHRDLAEAWAASPEPDPERLALHHERAGERQLAADFAKEAAHRALHGLSFDRAVRLATKALELGAFDSATTHELRVLRADSLCHAGRSLEAAEKAVEAMDGAGERERADLARRAGAFYIQAGRVDQAIPFVNVGLKPYGFSLARTVVGAILALMVARLLLWFRGYKPSSRRNERAVARMEAALPIVQALAPVDFIRFITGATHLTRTGLDSGERILIGQALALELWARSILGVSPEASEAMAEQTEASSAITRDPFASYMTASYRGGTAAATDPSAAAAHFERAQKVLDDQPHPAISHLGAMTAWNLLYLRSMMGDFPRVARAIPALLDDAQARGNKVTIPYLAGVPGAVARVAVHDLRGVRSDVERAARQWEGTPFSSQDIMLAQARLFIELYDGNLDAAVQNSKALAIAFRRSPVRHAKAMRAYVGWIFGWSELARGVALPEGTERTRALETAAKQVALIESVAAPLGIWFSPLNHAVLAAKGDVQGAVLGLRRQLRDESAVARRPVYAACARRGLGYLLGGQEGADLVAQADTILAERCGVLDPERFVATMAPGLAPPRKVP